MSKVEECTTVFAGKPFHRLYQCLYDVLCEGPSLKPTLSPGELEPFVGFCTYEPCVNQTATDMDDPCFRFKCAEGSPVYEQYKWCGFYPTDPKKVVLPGLLILALCTIVFLMAFMSCKERRQKARYNKSRSLNYGKLTNETKGNIENAH